ncbi:MAG: response regulator [Anaerolineae bacterium]|nr:response regulator [Anaerolineae bacterium]NUQ03964.1 response regulator [Anaerolineae bacterium]
MSKEGRLHLLVIEDDQDGQEVMATILAHLRLSFDVAGSAAEAEHFLYDSGRRYDAAIIDLALPDKDGWQILADIRDNPQIGELPCVAVTAFHTSKLREEALQAGFNAYFSKPVETTSFARSLEALL